MKDMSDYFNAPIVINNGRKRPLTEYGQAVYKFAKKVVYEYEQLSTNLDNYANHVNIYYDNDVSAQRILSLIKNFWEHNPNVIFHISNRDTNEIIRHLIDGTIDLGVINSSQDYTSINLQNAYRTYRINIGVLIHTGMPLYSHGFITSDRLLNYGAIFPTRDNIPDYIYKWFKTKDIPLANVHVQTKEDIIYAVTKGYGYTFAPTTYNAWLNDCMRVASLYPNLTLDIQTLYSPQAIHNKASSEFISYLNEAKDLL